VKQKISITINEKILADIDGIVDNIYIRNRSQAIEHLVGKALGESKVAVILAGGPEKGLRLEDGRLCVTAKIANLTLIEKAVRKLRDNSFKEIFIVGVERVITQIFEVLKDGNDFGVSVRYVEEKKSNGTADSLRLLKGKISSNFLVVYADVLFDTIKIEKLWNDHLTHNAVATLMMTTSPKPDEKGTLEVEGNSIQRFVQKPKQSDVYLVFSPIFAAGPEIFNYDGHSLEETIFPALAEKGLLIGHLSSQKEKHVHSVRDLR